MLKIYQNTRKKQKYIIFKEKQDILNKIQKLKNNINDLKQKTTTTLLIKENIHTQIKTIRDLQDKIKINLHKEQINALYDKHCSYYTSKISLIIENIQNICKHKIINITQCMFYVNNLVILVQEFHNDYVSDNKNISSSSSSIIHNNNTNQNNVDNSICFNCSKKNCFKETNDGHIICIECGIRTSFMGTPDTFKDQYDFCKYLSRSDSNDINYNSNNNNDTTTTKQYKNKKRRNSKISESVYIKNKTHNRFLNKGYSNFDLLQMKKDLKLNNIYVKNLEDNLKQRRSATYKRLNHFREIIKQVTALTTSRISTTLKEEFKKLLILHNINNNDLTPAICRKLQSFLKHDIKNYQTSVSLCKTFNPNFKPLTLSNDQKLLLEMKFIQLEQVFDKACEKVCPNRKNFPSYPQILFRLLQDIGIPDNIIINSSNFLKSNKLLYNADILHLEMCKLLHWSDSLQRTTISFF